MKVYGMDTKKILRMSRIIDSMRCCGNCMNYDVEEGECTNDHKRETMSGTVVCDDWEIGCNRVNGLVVSGFPGVGKSVCSKDKLKLDSDSSSFSWYSEGVKNPGFPGNYIEHIKNKMQFYEVVFVSSHKDVRDALVENRIPFVLVYPSKDCKDEYLKNYKNRGSDEKFIELISNNWDSWLDELNAQKNCDHVILSKGIYLDDVIDSLVEKFKVI